MACCGVLDVSGVTYLVNLLLVSALHPPRIATSRVGRAKAGGRTWCRRWSRPRPR